MTAGRVITAAAVTAAAAYLIRLAWSEGEPGLAAALTGGLVLIGVGIWLDEDRGAR